MATKTYTQEEVQNFFIFSKNRIETLSRNYSEQLEQWKLMFDYSKLLREKVSDLEKVISDNIDTLSEKTLEADRLKKLYVDKCQETYSEKQLER